MCTSNLRRQRQEQILQESTTKQSVAEYIQKPIIMQEGGSSLMINKIPAIIRPASKRTNVISGEPALKVNKCTTQMTSVRSPAINYEWRQSVGKDSFALTKKQDLGAAISSLPPNTIIKPAITVPASSLSSTTVNTICTESSIRSIGLYTATNSGVSCDVSIGVVNAIQNNNLNGSTPITIKRPSIYIKREVPNRTILPVTIELIEKDPIIHLGLQANRLPIVKNTLCTIANITLVDLYLVLKKLRQNEDFSLLATYFELSEIEVQQRFARGIVKLARYMRFLICWPDSEKFYDRHKYLPFAFRQNLRHVQSLIECVETDMAPNIMQIDCSNYKFILSINMNGIISYVSEAYMGNHDDLSIFNVTNFKNIIPSYLTLTCDPSRAIRRRRKYSSKLTLQRRKTIDNIAETDSTTDSADESADDLFQNDEAEIEDDYVLSKFAATRVAGQLASHQTLSVVNSELTSKRTKNFSIPMIRVHEPVCRLKIRHMINSLREFKILQSQAIYEPIIYQYINEILIVCAALLNLQR